MRFPHFLPILLALGLTSAAPFARAGALEQLKSFVEGTKSARANFSQTVTAKSGRKPQQAAGQMAFQRPGKFRWVYEKPYQQLLVGDGERLWVFDPELNQVSVKKLGQALGGSPAALLAGEEGALDKHFVLREAGSQDGLDWVEATPCAAESSFTQMRIGFAGSELRAMEILDNFGQTTRLAFGAMERNPALPAGHFKFVPPKGADVVGER